MIRKAIAWAGIVAISLTEQAALQLAHAQSGASGIEEIVVTARRREESLLDVPIAMQWFSAELLEAGGIDEIADLEYITPGLEIRPGTLRDSTPAFTIRGFQAGGDLLGNVEGLLQL